MDWKTETKKLKDLRQFEGNPRDATDKQRKDLDKSLEKFNLADPLVVNTDGEIIGGNFRYRRLLEKYGEDYEIDVRVPEEKLDREQAKELNLRLNKNQGQWNWDLLDDFVEEDLLEDVGFEGFEEPGEEEFIEMFDEGESETKSEKDKHQITFVLSRQDLDLLETTLEQYDKDKNRAIMLMVNDL